MNLPSGTVTFLFTDIEGSTRLWERFPDAMRAALERHDILLRKVIERQNGYVFKTVGDAFCAAFPTAQDALLAALDIQQALRDETWGETGPLRVRMGMHTGEAEERDNDYFGQTLNRVARLQSLAYGGQVLLSQATYELIRDHLPARTELRELGPHRLKDLNRAEHIHQVYHPDLPADFPPLKSLESFPNNLPIQLTSFVGREQEMADVKRLLVSHRLVTLLGTGGTGKTRLSLQVGADLLEQFPGGVYFVELAPLSDPALVPQAVASVLGVREEMGRPLTQTLADYLKPLTLLLILDNCEHLVTACARLSQSLLQACPHLTILASSREIFNIPGEMQYRVPSLRLPDPKARHTIESLSQYEAVRLFIDRVTAIQSAFTVTSENAPALAQVCYRLDGIPLAIELAAARARSLSVEEINNKLDNCFRLLTGGSRTALPRQQTLRALIDWSYDLLSDTEKRLLCRLSVFNGGWSLESAEAVCADEAIEDWEILDLLTNLADKSLVVAQEHEGHTRYRLLETIRQYAGEKLRESGEAESLEVRHGGHFLRFAEENTRHLVGAEQQATLLKMKAEQDNLRAALDRMLANQARSSLALAVAQGLFWYLGGFLGEGREYLERALALHPEAQDTATRADAFYQIGRLAVEQHDLENARPFLEQALRMFREVGNTKGAANVLNSLGTIAVRQNHYEDARTFLEESLTLQREIGYQAGIGAALANLGCLLQDLGDYEQACARYAESQALYEQMGNERGIATNLINRANTLYLMGDFDNARALAEQSLTIGRKLGDDWYIAYSLCSLAPIALKAGDVAKARDMAEEALAILRAVGDMGQAAAVLSILAEAAIREGDYERARTQLRESLLTNLESGQRREIVSLLETYAEMANRTGLAERATRLLGFATAQRKVLGAALPPIAQTEQEALKERIGSVLDAGTIAALYDEAKAWTLEQAVHYALADDSETLPSVEHIA